MDQLENTIPQEIWRVIFEFVSNSNKKMTENLQNVKKVDLICKKWKIWNKNSGWKKFWVIFGIPNKWIEKWNATESKFWFLKLKRILGQDAKLYDIDAASNGLKDIFPKVEDEDFVPDMAYFLFVWSFYSFAPLKNDYTTLGYFEPSWNTKSFLCLYKDASDDFENFTFLCLKGKPLKCRPAKLRFDNSAYIKEENKEDFGPGSIIYFSLCDCDHPELKILEERKIVEEIEISSSYFGLPIHELIRLVVEKEIGCGQKYGSTLRDFVENTGFVEKQIEDKKMSKREAKKKSKERVRRK